MGKPRSLGENPMQMDGLTGPGAIPKSGSTYQTASRVQQRGRLTGARRSDATLSVESEQHGNEEQA